VAAAESRQIAEVFRPISALAFTYSCAPDKKGLGGHLALFVDVIISTEPHPNACSLDLAAIPTALIAPRTSPPCESLQRTNSPTKKWWAKEVVY